MRRLHGIRRLRRVVPDRLWSSLARLLRPASSDSWYLPLRASATARLLEASRRDTRAWEAVEPLDDWNDFVRPRLAALRASLGVVLDSSGRELAGDECSQLRRRGVEGVREDGAQRRDTSSAEWSCPVPIR